MQYSYKLREAAGERIPNQYIVVLKNSVVSPTSVVPKAVEARNQGAELHHIYQNAIRGYSVRVPNSDVLASILSNPAVDYAQPDLIFRTTAQDLPTGVNRVDGDLSSTKSGDGTGSVDVDIAILDTGIDLDHPDLNVYREKTFVLGTTTANDDDNHGTRVSGLAAAIDDGKGVVGMAPGARLWAVKVLDSTGTGTDSDIIKGIDYVTANAAEIDTVNLSFGGEGPDSALHTAIANSVAAGVTYVASAGNDNRDAASQVPASFPEVITVSAIVDTDGKCGQLGFSTTVGDDDTLADFSNFGSIVDMAAPGVILKTTDLGGSYTTGNHFSGTSASAPVVTGAAALYKWTHPSASPFQIRDALRNSGSTPSTGCDGKGHGYFTGDGDGSPEPLLYMASASPPVDSTLPTLTGRTPASSATGVAVGSSIAATFSEAVQSGTVTGTTFTLKNSAVTSIAATVTYDSTTKTATLKPSAALASS
ncbi:MAG TPA: S8 family serine peptidase, partial [Nitrososphaeraceae archaeon]